MRYVDRRLRIVGTGSHVPAKVVTNEELAAKVSTTPEWIYENLGIRERRIAGAHEHTSDLAAQAGLNALAQANVDKNQVDLIIVATATPDRKAPSTACLVQHKMGINNECAAFDIAAVCSGFLYAMTTASQFINSGCYKTVLVIGADVFSKITDWSRRDCVFFGDGAGAVVLQADQGNGLFSSVLYANGAGQDNFTLYPNDHYFSMNGRAVYETGSFVLPKAVRTVLQQNDLQPSDIDLVIPHQPSIRILKNMASELGIPFSKVMTNMDRYANTSGATIPLLLDEVNRKGLIKKGNLVAFAAVGSGWAWGAALYRWS